MGGSGSPFPFPIPNPSTPTIPQKPTFFTGKDPTAKEAGSNPSADVYVATHETIQEPGIFGLLTPPQSAPLTPEETKADAQGANQIIDSFNSDNRQIAGVFGQKPITDFNVYVGPPPYTAGSGPNQKPVPGFPGAGHPYPQPGEPQHYEDNITVNISPNNPNQALGLTDAEAIESYEDRTGNWQAGLTNGEALSRALAFQMHPELARDPGFSTDPMQNWWKNGHKDYINGNPDFNPKVPMIKSPSGYPAQADLYGGLQTKNQASDANPNSNGAGTLFLQYMHDDLGYSWQQITSAKGTTLGEKYQSLTGKSGAKGFQNFINALPTVPGDPNKLDLPSDGSSPFTTKNRIIHAGKVVGHAVEQGVSTLWKKIKGLF